MSQNALNLKAEFAAKRKALEATHGAPTVYAAEAFAKLITLQAGLAQVMPADLAAKYTDSIATTLSRLYASIRIDPESLCARTDELLDFIQSASVAAFTADQLMEQLKGGAR